MVDQYVHLMSREEDDAHIHDEQEAQEEQVAQGLQEYVDAAPIPEDNAEDEEEAQQPRGVRDPGRPTQEVIDEHDLFHISYKPWCDACTRGRAKRKPNRTICGADSQGQFARVRMDYAYLTEKVGGTEEDDIG